MCAVEVFLKICNVHLWASLVTLTCTVPCITAQSCVLITHQQWDWAAVKTLMFAHLVWRGAWVSPGLHAQPGGEGRPEYCWYFLLPVTLTPLQPKCVLEVRKHQILCWGDDGWDASLYCCWSNSLAMCLPSLSLAMEIDSQGLVNSRESLFFRMMHSKRIIMEKRWLFRPLPLAVYPWVEDKLCCSVRYCFVLRVSLVKYQSWLLKIFCAERCLLRFLLLICNDCTCLLRTWQFCISSTQVNSVMCTITLVMDIPGITW